MKKIILTVMSICFFDCVMAQQTLTIKITNIKNDEGQIAVALYNSEKDFMKTRYQSKITKSVKGEVEIVFENIPSGSYSLSVMHDANVNKKLDSNLFGIPKEGFGFSNNAMGTFGPPSFEKAKVEVSSPKSISIAMRYM
ncbi:MAG: DUF2141 domain-containing protein [Cyclobacteriaceae bacterium]